MTRSLQRATAVVVGILTVGCAGRVIRPLPARTSSSEALLILPGFGYGRAEHRALAKFARSIDSERVDVYVPVYVSRGGLAESRAQLQRFLREQRLDRYERVHVFAFLAGGWTFNPMAELEPLRVASIVYDRSPFQERAPRIALERFGPLAWLRHGATLGELAGTPYPPLESHHVNVGLMVETRPTSIVRRFSKTARSYGPYRFDCEAFAQRFDDCFYLPMNHSEMYTRFAELWPELRTFIRTGRFTAAANRTPPSLDDTGAVR